MQLAMDMSVVDNMYEKQEPDMSSFVGFQNLISKSFKKIFDITKTFDERNDSFWLIEELSAVSYENNAIEDKNKQLELIARDRLELLIRSYSENSSTEEVIRFRMLSEKIKSLSPLINESESEFLTKFTETLSDISKREKKRKKFIDKIFSK